MTRKTNARIAGITFLVYIAASITGMALFARATNGEDVAAKLASIAQHTTDIRITMLLGLLMNISALVLAVTLYAITRDQDRDLAMMGLTCRLAEGIAGVDVSRQLGLLWLATAAESTVPGAEGAHALSGYLLMLGDSWVATGTFFAVGSTLFAWLFLRGRMIPVALSWLGLLASILLVVCLPLQLVRLLPDPVTSFIWLPMLVFELIIALWLIIKGVAAPVTNQQA